LGSNYQLIFTTRFLWLHGGWYTLKGWPICCGPNIFQSNYVVTTLLRLWKLAILDFSRIGLWIWSLIEMVILIWLWSFEKWCQNDDLTLSIGTHNSHIFFLPNMHLSLSLSLSLYVLRKVVFFVFCVTLRSPKHHDAPPSPPNVLLLVSWYHWKALDNE